MISSITAHHQAVRPYRPREAAPAQDHQAPAVRPVGPTQMPTSRNRQQHTGHKAAFIVQVLGQQTASVDKIARGAVRNYPSQRAQEVFGPAEEILPKHLFYLDLTV